jgi:superfamily I DNA/RNA helicase
LSVSDEPENIMAMTFTNKAVDEMHALSAHAWNYLPALKTVFESVGLDYLYHVNDFNKERFNAFT